MLSSLEAFSPVFCRALPWALALSLAAGCTMPAASPAMATVTKAAPAAPPAPSNAAPSEADTVTPLLAYADRLRSLPGPELAQEITRLGNAASAGDQLRLALTLSQTRQLPDLVRAQELLQRALANNSEEARPLHALARLLAARFAEQRRAEEQLDRQNQQLRDLQRRLEQTQDKLDALKEIERSLSNRPAAAPASSPRGRTRPPSP
jgi:exonuclease VII large subunit